MTAEHTAPAPTPRRWPRWVGPALAAISLAASAWFGLVLVLGTARPFQVAAGRSMSPTLETGDFVVLQGVAPEDLHVGDIVAIAVPPEAQSK